MPDARPTGPAATGGDTAPVRSSGEIREQAPQIARARAVAVTRTTPTRRLHPGDLVCGACGEGNPSTRSFCGRCGGSLVEAVRVKEPWWRRFVPRRGPRVVQLAPAGGGGRTDGTSAAHLTRPRFGLKPALTQIYRKGRIVVAVALLCAGALYGTYPPFRDTVDSKARGLKARATGAVAHDLPPIHAVSVTANVSEQGHPALNAADELLNRYWLAPWSNSAEPALTFKFAHHVTLMKIILHSGASNAYIRDGRPSELRLVYSNGESFTIVPKDTSKEQEFSISHAQLVNSVRIQVGAVYPGSSGSTVAISEIELFGLTT